MRKKTELNTYDAVKERALRLLEFRPHSERELTDKLRRDGATDGDIENVLEFCRRYGFVNDRAYAEGKVRDLVNLKKYGKRRVRAELLNKGIDSEIVEECLLNIETDEGDALREMVEKRLRGDLSQKNIEKCIRYFVYRGYDIYDIKDAVAYAAERCDEENGL